MANPAFQRSGETDNRRDDVSGEGGRSGGGFFAAYSTPDLIALRNRLLEECLDLEDRAAGAHADQHTAPDEPALVREKIDEIHQELALRDLAERVSPSAGRDFAAPAGPGNRLSGEFSLSAHAAEKSAQILEAIEMRSRFMDELAQVARDEGRLDQAATFTLNAQKLDMERVEVICQLSVLSGETTDTDE